MKKCKGLIDCFFCNPYFLKLGLVLLLLSYKPISFAVKPAGPTTHQSIFNQIKQLPEKDRLDKAYIIYRINFRHASLNVAMANLDTLSAIADELGDKNIQCSVFDMRADYYSVNKGFNSVSTVYYQKAIDYARDNEMPLRWGISLNNKAVYYFIYKQYAAACQCFLQSEEKFRQVGYANVPNIYVYLLHVIDFYYGLGDYENAKINLVEALKYVPDNSRDEINVINTLALIYRSNREFPQAIDYFNRALSIAIATKDTVWVGIVKGNIGSVYFLQGNYSKAIPYIIIDYNTSIHHAELVNGAIALLRLIKINIDGNNLKLAAKQLDTIPVLTKNTNEDILKVYADYYDLKSQLYEKLNRSGMALYNRKMYELEKDSLIRRNDITAIERVKLRYETDKRQSQLNKLQADARVENVKIRAALAVLILLFIISVLLYNRQRLADKKDKELIIAEKKIVDEQLKSADTALRGFTENLRQKNILIENFKAEIDQLNRESAGTANAVHLENLLQAHIMTDRNWNDFKKLFSKVYPGFFVNLNKNYPQLSATDTRLLALMKLGLNNSEMANMLGITVEGIKKAKQRLRKKIDTQVATDIDNPVEI